MIDDSYFKALEAEIKATKVAAERALKQERFLEAMKTYQGDDSIESSLDIEKRLKEGDPIPVYSTGVGSLDNLLRGGFRPGQLVVVSAITGHGKTEFCIFLTGKMKDNNPLYFSYEDGPDELVERFMDREIPVPLFYTPKELKQQSIPWLEERIVESKVKYGTQLVFIDNLQNLVPRGENLASEYGFVTRALKGLARKWGVCIVLVHHLTKTELEKQPTHKDLKGSSDIAQDADTVLLLWRRTGNNNGEVVTTNDLILNVSKARRGRGTGNIKLTFNGTAYYENEWDSDIETFERDKKF